MRELLEPLDILPGWKTNVTAIVTGILNLLSIFEVIALEPEQVQLINGIAVALIGLFLSMKIDRGGS